MALLPLVLAAVLAVDFNVAGDVALPLAGDEILVSAATQEQGPEGWLILSGYVVIEYPGGKIQADHVQYNQRTGDMVAEGNVVVESGSTVITGSRAEFDLEEGVGLIHDAVGWSEPDIQFRAEMVEKVSEDVYVMHRGEITSCRQALPIWHIKWTKAKLHQGEIAQMWNTVIKFKKAPLFYAPYMVFPVEDERTTGFLMPHISSSRSGGVSGDFAYFWAISRNTDITFALELSKEEQAFSPHFRYVLNEQSAGELKLRYTHLERDDRETRELEGFYNHRQSFGAGYRWIVDLDYTSSIELTRGLSTNVNRATIDQIASVTHLSKSWDAYSVTYRAEDRRWPSREQELQRLPEVELIQRSRQIGKAPVYWGFSSSATRIHARQDYRVPDTGETFESSPTYGRIDIRPTIRFPFSKLPWLDVQPEISLRETIYSAHLDPDEPQIVDEVLTRESGSFRLSVAGPKMERFYGLSREPGRTKYQQLIEPNAVWFYAPDVTDADLVIPFDSVDRVGSMPNPRDPSRDIDTNRIDFGVTTRLLAKQIVAPGEQEESSREVFSWRLSSAYMVNTWRQTTIDGRPERSRFNNVSSDLRWLPTRNAQFTLRNTYDVLADDITSASLTGSVGWGRELHMRFAPDEQCHLKNCIRFAYTKNRSTALDTRSEALNVYAEWRTYGERLRFTTDVRYDLLNSKMNTQKYIFRYVNQCLGARIEYFWNRFGERRITFTVNLKNVGEFVDFRQVTSGP